MKDQNEYITIPTGCFIELTKRAERIKTLERLMLGGANVTVNDVVSILDLKVSEKKEAEGGDE
jgi:hypothetical protein